MYLITLQGLPPAMQLAGMSFTTTLPAAIIEQRPIVTPLLIILRAPINTLSSIVTGAFAAFPGLSFFLSALTRQSVLCIFESRIKHPAPIFTFSPMVIRSLQIMTVELMPELSPIDKMPPPTLILDNEGETV